MVPVKVRKKDKELASIASCVKSIVDIAERIVVENVGQEYAVKHKVNLYLGDRQYFANNPRSGRMYIQYRKPDTGAAGPDSDLDNLYITGVLHEIGHSYLKIENSLRRARESIASEGLANVFALLLLEEVCGKLGKDSWLVKNSYPEREKKWYADLFREKKVLFPPLETARFLHGAMDRDSLFRTIRRFNLRHRTCSQFEDILGEVLGESVKAGYRGLVDSLDLREYALRNKKKL